MGADAETIAAARSATMRLTSVAGLAGAPVVVLALSHDGDLPLGIAYMGARAQTGRCCAG